jgi:hypothetical protein
MSPPAPILGGAQIPLYSIETSDFGLWPIYTYIEDFRKTKRPSNRRAGAHTTHGTFEFD